MRKQPSEPRTASLLRTLLGAMGLGALSSAAIAGCGGKAVVEHGGEGGSGASGATGTTSTTQTATTAVGSTAESVSVTASSSSGGSFVCDAPSAGGERHYVCSPDLLSPGGCPDKDTEVVYDTVMKILSDQGCGGSEVYGVPCGPDPTVTDQCCYYADGIVYECGGRPFLVEGAPRVAKTRDRDDWLALFRPQVGGLDDATRAVLSAHFQAEAQFEHASVASFARFVLELLALGAPASFVEAAQRAMGDEIRHAKLCYGLASGYEGREIGPSALAIPASLPIGTTLAEVATEVVWEGCVGETLAALAVQRAFEESTEPAVCAALSEIETDEASHAALSWRFVAWALAQGDVTVEPAVRAAFQGAIAAARRSLPQGETPSLWGHGMLSAADRRQAAEEALRDVVAPCMEALLDARGRGERAPLSAFGDAAA